MGTRSMFGPQVLASRASAPSFSFGTGPSRIMLTAGSIPKGPLRPSVANSSSKTPGPIYNPRPTTKWLGDGPRAGFGTEVQRPVPTTADISKHTGKSLEPGPGTYALAPSIGPQALAGKRSNQAYSFGHDKQRVPPGAFTDDPGPVYDVPQSATARGPRHNAAYSFGSSIQRPSARLNRTPGPGQYAIPPTLGPQVSSDHRSQAVVGFGQPSMKGEVGRPLGLGTAAQTPGPKYAYAVSNGKQQLTGFRSMPVMAFPRAQRFTVADLAGAFTPGPGDYLV